MKRGRVHFPRGSTLSLIAVAIVAFGMPLAWLTWTTAQAAWREPSFDAYRWGLLVRTLIYSGLAGALATALGLIVARVLRAPQARRPGELSRRLLLACVPATLIIPSLVYAYGGQQTLAVLGFSVQPASLADVARCVVTLAAWLWGVPAAVVALAWHRLDPSTLQQARLDGAYGRITLRLLAGPLLAAWCVTTAIASQEFAVFETTGISVVATEVRVVFETGVFLGGPGALPPAATTGVSNAPPETVVGADQATRAAGAVAVGWPALGATFILFAVGLLFAWHLIVPPTDVVSALATEPGKGDPPRHLAAWAVVGLTLGVPLVALLASLKDPTPPWQWMATFRPQLAGTLLMAVLGTLTGAGLAVLGSLTRPWLALGLGLCTFLAGGLFVGIALIRLYNRPTTFWVYDSVLITLLAYVARFGWVALLAAGVAHGPVTRRLKDMAAVDGAGAWTAFGRVVLPTVWPTLLAGAVGVGLLAAGEVPATMLVAPPSPRLLTPLLLSWVHMQRYEPMIQACLMLVGACLLVSVPLALMAGAFTRSTSRPSRGRRPPEESS